ncbi:MAG: hypothetical protein NVSMB62_26520 [Acidobacteriaceae bacterium]
MQTRTIFCLLAGAVFVPAGFAQNTLHLTLAEAEKLAIQNNPSLSASALVAQAAGQSPIELRSALQPTVYGSFTGVGADNGSRLAAGSLNNPVIYNRVGSGLTVNQLVTDFGRTRNLVESAKLHAQALDQTTISTKAQILLQTDRAYFAVLRTQAVLKVAQQTVAARQLVSEQVSALAQSKLKSNLDVSFANVNLQEARLLLASAQNDLDSSIAELATAMGLPGERGFVLAEEPMPPLMPDTVGPLIQEAIRRRPELENLRLEQTSAERFERAEHELWYPSIGLIASAGFVPAGQIAIPGRYGAAGLNVNVPVLNGGLFKARRLEAEFRARAAADNTKDLGNRIVRDVRIAFLNATTALDRLSLTAQLLAQAQLALDLAQSRYDLGLSSIVELSQAQLNLTSAQISSESAKYDYQSQRAILEFQIGAKR